MKVWYSARDLSSCTDVILCAALLGGLTRRVPGGKIHELEIHEFKFPGMCHAIDQSFMNLNR